MSSNQTSSGTIFYCFAHDQGCLILGDSVPNHLPQVCYGSENSCANDCEWEDIGSFSIHLNGIFSLSCPNYEKSRGWKNSFYLQNLYTSDMQPVTFPKKNGIILQCFEHRQTCYLLANRIPINKQLDYLCKGADQRCSACEWEDVGHFSIEKNKIKINNGDKWSVVPKDLNIYDENLEKIRVQSY
jgi:hypothetical protein